MAEPEFGCQTDKITTTDMASRTSSSL